jgi:hypothetical protein
LEDWAILCMIKDVIRYTTRNAISYEEARVSKDLPSPVSRLFGAREVPGQSNVPNNE